MSGPGDLVLLQTMLERLQSSESLEVEHKRGRGGLPKDLWPTVSAFANTNGGWIILGIREEEGSFEVEGVPNEEQRLKEFYDQLRNKQKVSYSACGSDDAKIVPLGEHNVIVIRVPAAPRRDRPVYIGGNPYLGTYVRRHTGDYLCTKPEVDRMMRDASDVTADSAVIEHFGLDDIDQEALRRYRRRFQNHDFASPWNGYENAHFLQALGAYRKDRQTNKRGLTAAGLLLLGKRESIKEWRPRHLIDYRMMSQTESSTDRWDDRIAWDGNLFAAFEAIYPKLIVNQPIPFRLKDGARTGESPAHIAMREALVNLLVHADYAESQASLIIQSPDGCQFRNPGSSRVPETDLFIGDRSDPRNPVLVTMFRLIGFADEAGTGIPKIVQAWQELGFQYPAIDAGTERYEFDIRLRHAHLLSDDDRSWLQATGKEWTEEEQLALVCAKNSKSIDNAQLRRLSGQHPADASKTLVGLRNQGLLKLSKLGRGAYYELEDWAIELAESSMRPKHGLPATRGGTVSAPNLDVVELSPSSHQVDSVSGVFDPDEPMNPPPSFKGSHSLWDTLLADAKPLRDSSRVPIKRMETTIVELCRRIPLSIEELGILLGRQSDHTRTVVRRLLERGLLQHTFPETPTHPEQRYRAFHPNLFE